MMTRTGWWGSSSLESGWRGSMTAINITILMAFLMMVMMMSGGTKFCIIGFGEIGQII